MCSLCMHVCMYLHLEAKIDVGCLLSSLFVLKQVLIMELRLDLLPSKLYY